MVGNNELSRRSFLKRSGALTLGSVAAGSALLTGCDNPNNHLIHPKDEVSEVPDVPKWLGVEPEISDKDIKETLETDVLIKCGTTGRITAARTLTG